MTKTTEQIKNRNVAAITHYRVERIKTLDHKLSQLKNKGSKKYKQLAAERFALLPKSYQEKEQNS